MLTKLELLLLWYCVFGRQFSDCLPRPLLFYLISQWYELIFLFCGYYFDFAQLPLPLPVAERQKMSKLFFSKKYLNGKVSVSKKYCTKWPIKGYFQEIIYLGVDCRLLMCRNSIISVSHVEAWPITTMLLI